MPPTIRDASLVTKKNRDIALNSFYNSWKTATMNTPNANPAVTSPASTSAEVLAEIRNGCSACAALENFNAMALGAPMANLTRYPPNTSFGGASGLTGSS